LGLATLQILLKAGVSVLAVCRTETAALSALVTEYPGALLVSKGDVADDETNKKAVDKAIDAFGRLDAVILNAGVLGPINPIEKLNVADVKKLFDVNYFSLVSLLTHAIPYLKMPHQHLPDGITGRVILVSSGAATGGLASWSSYNASKAAMNSLGRTLANEEPNIVTVAVKPGKVDTDLQNRIRTTTGIHMRKEDHKKFTDALENGDLIPPSKPGKALAGLALEAPKSLTGQFLVWDDAAVAKVSLK